MTTHHALDRVERLWTAADGTTCVLSTCDAAPHYSLALIRHDKVVRECRLYGDASARMLAQSWDDAYIAPR